MEAMTQKALFISFLIPQTCTFLANKLLKAGKTLIFQLVIL